MEGIMVASVFLRTFMFNGLMTGLFGMNICSAHAVPEYVNQSGTGNGYRIECPVRNLQAEITVNGTIVQEIDKGEPRDILSIKLLRLGRRGKLRNIEKRAIRVNRNDSLVCREGKEIVEEYTASKNGIRQDFVISDRPEGNGCVRVELAFCGAETTAIERDCMNDTFVRVCLYDGRKLRYHALKVRDAVGTVLPAEFDGNGKGVVIINVDDEKAVYPVRIDPTITDEGWSVVGQSNGFYYTPDRAPIHKNKFVYVFDGDRNLFVCPPWSDMNAGGVLITSIAKWDKKKWCETGFGIDGNTVEALAVDSAGNLYAGGTFDSIGYLKVNHIAKWDGTSWYPVGNGIAEGGVYALAITADGNIYAGYMNPFVTDSSTNGIKMWDGSGWRTLGILKPHTGGSGYMALELDNQNNLYLGASFDSVDAIEAHNIAKWDGTIWSALGDGLRSPKEMYFQGVHNICCNDNALYAKGNFDSAGTIAAHCIARWNGSTWSNVEDCTFSSYGFLAADRVGNVYIEAHDSTPEDIPIMKEDGISLKIIDDGGNHDFRGYMIEPSGMLYALDGIEGLMQWRNDSWVPVCSENGVNGEVYSSAFDATTGKLYIGGDFRTTGDKIVNGLAIWNGGDWSPIEGNPNIGASNGIINALVCDRHGYVYISGNNGNAYKYIAGWDGVAWDTVAQFHDFSESVYALAVDSADNLYAAGVFDSIGDVETGNIARWDGSVWKPLAEGVTGSVQALAFDENGNLYAGGTFDKAGREIAHNIARWDGHSWHALGKGIQLDPDTYCPVFALAVDAKDGLIAAGNFTLAGGSEAHSIARWDGAEWSPVGGGIDRDEGRATVYALTIDREGRIYAGGDFTRAGDVEVNNIARWDGNAWCTLGKGISGTEAEMIRYTGTVSTLAYNNENTLYIGGDFNTAGGMMSSGFAMYAVSDVSGIPARRTRTYRQPACYDNRRGTLHIPVSAGMDAVVSIYTVTGRIVYRVVSPVGSDNHGLTIGTSVLSPGMYLVRINAGRESMCYRFIVGR